MCLWRILEFYSRCRKTESVGNSNFSSAAGKFAMKIELSLIVISEIDGIGECMPGFLQIITWKSGHLFLSIKFEQTYYTCNIFFRLFWKNMIFRAILPLIGKKFTNLHIPLFCWHNLDRLSRILNPSMPSAIILNIRFSNYYEYMYKFPCDHRRLQYHYPRDHLLLPEQGLETLIWTYRLQRLNRLYFDHRRLQEYERSELNSKL